MTHSQIRFARKQRTPASPHGLHPVIDRFCTQQGYLWKVYRSGCGSKQRFGMWNTPPQPCRPWASVTRKSLTNEKHLRDEDELQSRSPIWSSERRQFQTSPFQLMVTRSLVTQTDSKSTCQGLEGPCLRRAVLSLRSILPSYVIYSRDVRRVIIKGDKHLAITVHLDYKLGVDRSDRQSCQLRCSVNRHAVYFFLTREFLSSILSHHRWSNPFPILTRFREREISSAVFFSSSM